MIIDLTVVFNALHDMWDVLGIGALILFLLLFLVGIAASTIKAFYYIKYKLEKGE